MSARIFGSMMAMAAVVAVLWLALVPAAGSGSLVRFVAVAEASAHRQAQGATNVSMVRPSSPSTLSLPNGSTFDHAQVDPELTEGSKGGGGAQAPGAAAKTWDPPRTPDGQPDMQGYWGAEIGTTYSVANVDFVEIFEGRLRGLAPDPRIKGTSRIVEPADGKVPYQPWAAAKFKEIFDHHADPNVVEQVDPQARCFQAGVPRVMYVPDPMQILQPNGSVVFLHEFIHSYQIIPLDGRPHIGGNIHLWMGDSRGRWEGNTLVVDTTNSNGKAWFDMIGNFQSDGLHTIARFTLVAPDRIQYEVTVEDSKLYTRPWKMVVPIVRIKEAGYQLMEHACHEGNRAPALMLAR